MELHFDLKAWIIFLVKVKIWSGIGVWSSSYSDRRRWQKISTSIVSLLQFFQNVPALIFLSSTLDVVARIRLTVNWRIFSTSLEGVCYYEILLFFSMNSAQTERTLGFSGIQYQLELLYGVMQVELMYSLPEITYSFPRFSATTILNYTLATHFRSLIFN